MAIRPALVRRLPLEQLVHGGPTPSSRRVGGSEAWLLSPVPRRPAPGRRHRPAGAGQDDVPRIGTGTGRRDARPRHRSGAPSKAAGARRGAARSRPAGFGRAPRAAAASARPARARRSHRPPVPCRRRQHSADRLGRARRRPRDGGLEAGRNRRSGHRPRCRAGCPSRPLRRASRRAAGRGLRRGGPAGGTRTFTSALGVASG